MIYDPQQRPIMTGWQETTGAKLWHISLRLGPTNIPTLTTVTKRAPLLVFFAYNLSNVEALVQYFHAEAGLHVRDTWLQSIKYGN